MDFLAFEVGEIEEAALKTGEDEELERAYRRQVNSQKIMEGSRRRKISRVPILAGLRSWYRELTGAFLPLRLMMKTGNDYQ
ncbi:MAG: hypothetical protein ACLR6B_08570 [Blautia sp.]